ncbi:hypothetical protein GEMRC1_012086 [Eukaryota sp. GEM-RC1]
MNATEKLVRKCHKVTISSPDAQNVHKTTLTIQFRWSKHISECGFWEILFAHVKKVATHPYSLEMQTKRNRTIVTIKFPKTTPWFHYEPSSGIPDRFQCDSNEVLESNGAAHLLLMLCDVSRLLNVSDDLHSFNSVILLLNYVDELLDAGVSSFHSFLSTITSRFMSMFPSVHCYVSRTKHPKVQNPQSTTHYYYWTCTLSESGCSSIVSTMLSQFLHHVYSLSQQTTGKLLKIFQSLGLSIEVLGSFLQIRWKSRFLNRNCVNFFSKSLTERSKPLSICTDNCIPEFSINGREDFAGSSVAFCNFLKKRYGAQPRTKKLSSLPFCFLQDSTVPPILQQLWDIVPLVGFTDDADCDLTATTGPRTKLSGSGWVYPIGDDKWVLVTNNHVISPCKERFILAYFRNGSSDGFTSTLLFNSFVCSSPTRQHNYNLPQIDAAVGIFENYFSLHSPEKHAYYKQLFNPMRYIFKHAQDPVEFMSVLNNKRDVYLISHPGSTISGPAVSRSRIKRHDYYTFSLDLCSLPGSSGVYWSPSRKMMTFSLLAMFLVRWNLRKNTTRLVLSFGVFVTFLTPLFTRTFYVVKLMMTLFKMYVQELKYC